MLQLWDSHHKPSDPTVLLDGTWQSCRDDDGYGERVYEHVVNGVFQWELHMGPYHDFALYATRQDDATDDHDSPMNLLKPGHTAANQDPGEWNVPALKLHVSAHMAGGSRDECETFVVAVERLRR